MPGFITHYLFGTETCERLSPNYIKDIISDNNHAFLLGLQGSDIFPFYQEQSKGIRKKVRMNPLDTDSLPYFNHMLDYIQTLEDKEKDICSAYLAGCLCHFTIEHAVRPYLNYRINDALMAQKKCSLHKAASIRYDMETTIDVILLRELKHIEPSQLNFDALTYANKKELTSVSRCIFQTIRSTYGRRVSQKEVINSLRGLRKQSLHLDQKDHLRRFWYCRCEPAIIFIPAIRKWIYEDYQADIADYMNSHHQTWQIFPYTDRSSTSSFDDLFDHAIRHSCIILEALDSHLSWGMSRKQLEDTMTSIKNMY